MTTLIDSKFGTEHMQRTEITYRNTHQRHLSRFPWSHADVRNYRSMMRGSCTQEQRILWWVTGLECGVFEQTDYFGEDHALVQSLYQSRTV